MSTAAPETGLVRATVDCPSRSVRWQFPVVDGTPPAVVRAEILARVKGTPVEDVPVQPDFVVHYPDGPFVGLPQTPPIGAVVTPDQPSAPPNGTPTPPSARETGLPRHPGEPTGDRAALLDLDGLLTTWRSRYGLTSAEYHAFLSQALARHASQLLGFERHLAAQMKGRANHA